MSKNSKKRRDMKKKKLKKGKIGAGMNQVLQLTPKGWECIRQLQAEGVIP